MTAGVQPDSAILKIIAISVLDCLAALRACGGRNVSSRFLGRGSVKAVRYRPMTKGERTCIKLASSRRQGEQIWAACRSGPDASALTAATLMGMSLGGYGPIHCGARNSVKASRIYP